MTLTSRRSENTKFKIQSTQKKCGNSKISGNVNYKNRIMEELEMDIHLAGMRQVADVAEDEGLGRKRNWRRVWK